MGTNDFRNVHDVVTEWPFTMDPDIEVFTEGTNKMDKEDFQTALTMMYECFGWDPELGCPTAECLDYYDMPDVKEDLAALGYHGREIGAVLARLLDEVAAEKLPNKPKALQARAVRLWRSGYARHTMKENETH